MELDLSQYSHCRTTGALHLPRKGCYTGCSEVGTRHGSGRSRPPGIIEKRIASPDASVAWEMRPKPRYDTNLLDRSLYRTESCLISTGALDRWEGPNSNPLPRSPLEPSRPRFRQRLPACSGSDMSRPRLSRHGEDRPFQNSRLRTGKYTVRPHRLQGTGPNSTLATSRAKSISVRDVPAVVFDNTGATEINTNKRRRPHLIHGLTVCSTASNRALRL